ncbi:MAG: hypothetical protein FGM40_04850 [Rhodocyclaceae bacterium]|nr:hypothetical protein [Rhodocyclaceae bacterium]
MRAAALLLSGAVGLVTAASAATAAQAAWQVVPLVDLAGGFPVRCGYLYTEAGGMNLLVEKGLRSNPAGPAQSDPVITAIEARGADAIELVTRTFDSRRALRPVEPAPAVGARLEADLQDDDAGGALFAELAVSGGLLRVGVRHADATDLVWREVELPAPLPRGVAAMYLNCAGDLIRPE